MCAVHLEVRDIAKTFESGLFAKKTKSVLKNISF
jgi:ABC-type antimicrobial peptide transport system ATPase subunit